MVRWGLVPSWAESTAIGDKLINARAESIAEKAAYKPRSGAAGASCRPTRSTSGARRSRRRPSGRRASRT